MVDVVDLASGILRQSDGPFQSGPLRQGQPFVLTLRPLLLVGEKRLQFGCDFLKFLDSGIPIFQMLSKDRDFALQFSVLACKDFERLFQRTDRRLQLEHPFVPSGIFVPSGTRNQSDGHQDADRHCTKVSRVEGHYGRRGDDHLHRLRKEQRISVELKPPCKLFTIRCGAISSAHIVPMMNA